jgi:V-type H+-transporting ATPase subunit E
MVAFIKQEALEKAREIEIKADEEFAIEKSRLVRAETAAIDTQYERKYKQASLAQQIARSTVANKTRIKVLSARQTLLDDIFEEARGKLKYISDDEGRYEEVLANLVLEGLFLMNEQSVELRCRSCDNDIVGRAVEKAKEGFKGKMGGDVAVTIDHDWPLPEES